MLAIVLFLGFWVLLALVLVFVALRGGLGGARDALHAQTSGGRKAISTGVAIVYVGFGVALPIIFLTGNHARASSHVAGLKLTRAEKHGRELFGENCAVCHTLAAANADGKVGPNLDVLRAPKSLVLHTLQNGCLQNPPSNSPEACLGNGTMPAAIVQGKDAEDVSQFLARVAGK